MHTSRKLLSVSGRVAAAIASGSKELDLSFLDLTELSESIGQLRPLQRLQRLDVNRNRLTTLPESIGQLTQLQELHLAYNLLTELPESIGQLTQLRHLDLSGNELTTLPESIGQLTQLQELGLSRNQLDSLPESLRKLRSLKRLWLRGNDKLDLPWEVVDKFRRPTKILEYYFRVRIDRRPLNEAKLILVGRGAAGKTSIVNRLAYDRFDPNQRKTEGIQITGWKLLLTGNEDMRLNVWDFGGQEIMPRDPSVFPYPAQSLPAGAQWPRRKRRCRCGVWLRIIESFGSDSPVIVVLNKIKEHPFDVNRRGLQQKFPAIRDFVETDCEDATGVKELHKAIERETDRLEHLPMPFLRAGSA